MAEALRAGRALDRVHLRRADGLPRVRAGHRPAGPCRGPAQPVHHRRVRDAGGDRPARHGPRRGQRRPEGLRRGVLPSALRGATRPRPRGARGLSARRRLARGDHARHPGRERRPGRATRAHRLARRAPRAPRRPGTSAASSRRSGCRTVRRRRSRRSVAPPRSAGRPACATSTSATRPSWRWRTPTASAATTLLLARRGYRAHPPPRRRRDLPALRAARSPGGRSSRRCVRGRVPCG